MLQSFKLKIVLSCVLLSGALLLGFGLYFVQTSRQIGLDRIDRELRAMVDFDMRKEQPKNHWEKFDGSLKSLFDQHAEKQFLLRVADDQNEPLFTSSRWQHEIGTDNLPVSERPDRLPKKPRQGRKRQQKDRSPPARLPIGKPEYTTHSTWRIMTVRNPDITLELAISLEPLNAEIARFERALLFAVPIALIFLVVIGWLLARLALRPVNIIAQTAEQVTALHLDQRIPAEKADQEFKRLINIINRMFQRLETSFSQATRFSADAAHELKTPLTILQGQLETALQSAAADDQLAFKESLDEVQRLKAIIRKLLLLSQADAGRLPLHFQTLDFTVMIENLIEDIRILNPAIEVVAELEPGVTIEADDELLTQVIQNLAGNAVKYCRNESPVTLTLTTGKQIEFTISNVGQRIASEDHEKIFERFYRADPAHNRKIEGTGLGLSLAREIARAHGGKLILESSGADGTVFCLTLPRCQITES